MKLSRLYLFMALLTVLSLAAVTGCTTAAPATNTPVPPSTPAAPPVVVPPAAVPAGPSDLVVTKVWLDGQMVNYTVKNIGTGDSPQTDAYLYVDDINPAMGGSSFVDVLKPGEEKTLSFTNYQWPYGLKSAKGMQQQNVNAVGYILPNLDNYKVSVCADAQNKATESNEANNCKVTIVGIPWELDLLPIAQLATWRNADGNVTEPGSEKSAQGAHFQIPNANMEVIPQLETIPQQVPQGFMQGIFGYFYSEKDTGSPKTAAIQVPTKLHFIAKVGLASNATGNDGVTYKFGLRDLNDTVTWVASKKMTNPGVFENWDVDLSNYEGQKDYFVLRVDAGDSPVNDYAIWSLAKLLQVND